MVIVPKSLENEFSLNWLTVVTFPNIIQGGKKANEYLVGKQ